MGCRGDDVWVCPNSGSRICAVQKCDKSDDCPDGEDEHPEYCGIGAFFYFIIFYHFIFYILAFGDTRDYTIKIQ